MEKLLQIKNLRDRTELSKYVIYKLIEENKFPKPIVLTNRISVWKESEVQKFIDDPLGYEDYLVEQETLSKNIAS